MTGEELVAQSQREVTSPQSLFVGILPGIVVQEIERIRRTMSPDKEELELVERSIAGILGRFEMSPDIREALPIEILALARVRDLLITKRFAVVFETADFQHEKWNVPEANQVLAGTMVYGENSIMVFRQGQEKYIVIPADATFAALLTSVGLKRIAMCVTPGDNWRAMVIMTLGDEGDPSTYRIINFTQAPFERFFKFASTYIWNKKMDKIKETLGIENLAGMKDFFRKLIEIVDMIPLHLEVVVTNGEPGDKIRQETIERVIEALKEKTEEGGDT